MDVIWQCPDNRHIAGLPERGGLRVVQDKAGALFIEECVYLQDDLGYTSGCEWDYCGPLAQFITRNAWALAAYPELNEILSELEAA